MAITQTRLAAAKRATLTLSLAAALAALGAGKADAVSSAPHPNAHARTAADAAPALFDAFAGLRATAPPHKTSSNVITVTSCADDGSDGTLRKAIEGASDGDTIDMSGLNCSLITLQSGALISARSELDTHWSRASMR